VVDAFSGVTTPLSAVFLGGFLYGTPTMFFDVALLWMADSTLERRIPTRGTGSGAKLLSWSWMGWQGSINPWSWNTGADYMKQDNGRSATSVRTVPCTHWYAHHKDRRTVILLQTQFRQEGRFLVSNSNARSGRGTNRLGQFPIHLMSHNQVLVTCRG
jgi:hypothetical protein